MLDNDNTILCLVYANCILNNPTQGFLKTKRGRSLFFIFTCKNTFYFCGVAQAAPEEADPPVA